MDYYYKFGVMRFDYKWWAALSCTLLHGSHFHLIGNLLFFGLYGCIIERVVGIWKYLTIYISGAFISVNAHLITQSSLFSDEPLIGASGAVSAVLGSFLVLMPKAKLRTLYFDLFSFRPIIVELPAYIVLALWFIGQLLYTLNVVGGHYNVAFWAHIAGFATGAGLAEIIQILKLKDEHESSLFLMTAFREAWQAYLKNDLQTALIKMKKINNYRVQNSEGLQSLLKALLDVHHGHDAQSAMDNFCKSFKQSIDYRNYPKQIIIYLQMILAFENKDIPAEIHRDAGIAAAALKNHELALYAYHKAFYQGFENRIEQVLQSLDGIYRHKLNRDDLADKIKALSS